MKSKAICILGMHRSGTSTITRAINFLGAYLGEEKDLIAPADDNPEGFWERADVVALHDRIFAQFMRTTSTVAPLPTNWHKSPEIQPFKEELRALIQNHFSNNVFWAWKDPRTCLTFDLWKDLLMEMDIELSVVFMVRNPLDVANSLKKRNEIPTEKSLGFWFGHNIMALHSCLDVKKVFVSYDCLLDNWKHELQRCSEALGIHWPIDELTLNNKMNSFLKPYLRHSKSTSYDLDKVSTPIKRLYDILGNCLYKPSDLDETTTAEIISLYRTYQDYSSFYQIDMNYYFNIRRSFIDRERIISDQDAKIKELEEQLADNVSQTNSLNCQITEQQQQIITISSKSEDSKLITMDASVVICTYNRADLLGETIKAIQNQDFPHNKYEILVVDNNSSDATPEIVRRMALNSSVTIRYIFEEKQGLAYARNIGIREARGEVVAFVDDDIDADKSWLSSIITAFEDENVVATGGPIRPLWPIKKPDWLTERWQGFYTINEFVAASKTGEYTPPTYPWGANMAFSKDIFTAVGMFSTDLGRKGNSLLSCEEQCLFNRIYVKGGKVAFAPNAIIFHKIPASRIEKQWLYHRTYWQGRSEAIIDLNESKVLYRNLVDKLSRLSCCQTNCSDFDRRCLEKTALGYIYQILTSKNEFKKLRALKVMHRTLTEHGETTLTGAPIIAEEAANCHLQELLRAKDEHIHTLTNSLSWRITKPLRKLYDLLNVIVR